MGQTIGGHILKERHDELSAAAAEAAYFYRRAFLHRRLDILVETRRDKMTGSLKGYSDNYIKVHFDGPDELMKSITPVKVSDVSLTRTMGSYGE
jgi:tRNA A37 methylthiotransferase MiaB